MIRNEQSLVARLLGHICSGFGLGLVAVVVIASYAWIVYTHYRYAPPDATVIRLCHWQLEPGFRQQLQELCNEYEERYRAETGQRLKIVQMPINGRAYDQFINCGLTGGVAPDIIESGRASMTRNPSFTARFFAPLGEYLERPNPANAGTGLAGVPWRETYENALLNVYDPVLLDYYSVPFSLFTIRYFYNQDLYRALMGHDGPPRDMGELAAFFERTAAWNRDHPVPLLAMGGSQYQKGHLTHAFGAPFAEALVARTDLDGDGASTPEEAYLAYRRCLWRFSSPELLAMLACLKEFTDHFQDGWQAAQRDDALFLFLQQRCVMLSSGSWDAGVIPRLAAGKFRVGVFTMPSLATHPRYGQYVRGPAGEVALAPGIPWSINAASPHRDICAGFLQYCTSQRQNERFCRALEWVPVIQGARPSGAVEPFMPNLRGITSEFNAEISSAVKLRGSGLQWLVLAGKLTPQEYAAKMDTIFSQTGAAGFRQRQEQEARRWRDNGRLLANELARRCLAPGDEALERKVRERIASQANNRLRWAEWQARDAGLEAGQ